MQNDKIKIYISCHKECYVPNHPMLFPVQVGTANSNIRFEGMYHDDEGDNISEKNPSYCELTAQYWAWKNDKDADYYGFFHYRRYMSFSDKQLETNLFEDAELEYLDDNALETLQLFPEKMKKLITQYDVIGTTPVNLKKLHRVLDSNYTQYVIPAYQYEEDLEVMMDIIKERHPEFYDIAEYYMKKAPYGYFCNMFIMKKQIFNEYCEWLFDILEEHEKRRDYTNYNIDGYRVSGYLAERLFGIYYLYLQQNSNIKHCDLQRTLFANSDKNEVIMPAFEQNNVAIALAFDDFYAPYAATLLESIVENASYDNNYDILCLSTRVNDNNKKIIQDMLSGIANVQLRFVNPKRMLSEHNLYTRGHFSVETYYRLVLPELLKDYDKILYIDSDMVVEHDLAELFQEDVEGYLLAACYDADTSGLYNGFDPKKKGYTDNIMRLKNPYNYFQAGTLLMNLKEFRETFTTQYILDFAAERNWELLDQDVLNMLCQDKVKYVDMKWNVMVDYENIRISHIIRLAPQWQYKMYMEARKEPYIVHYAGPDKPWYRADLDMADIFWKYARNTPYYEIILQRMMQTVASWDRPRQNSSLIRGGMQCIRDHGLLYTLKYIPKRLARDKE